MNAGTISTANAREMAARSVERRKQRAIERQYAANPTATATAPNGNGLCVRADDLNDLLDKLKANLRSAIAAGQSQDALRYAQAIDRLEQSWARYAGIPTPPKARPQSRRQPPAAGPLD